MTSMAELIKTVKEDGPSGPKPSPCLLVKLPTYSEESSENVLVWIMQTKTVFLAQGITDEKTQVQYAATSFTDAALHWYLNRCKANNDATPFENWDTFVTALQEAFQPPHYQQHLRRQLRLLRQTGSVQDYGTKFRNIVGQITDMSALDQITYFIEGLKPATKMEISYQAPETLEDAWKLAIRYDTAMYGQGRPLGLPSRNNNNHCSQNSHRSHQNNGPIPMELDQAESHYNNRRNNNNQKNNKPKGTCYNCDKPDHFAKNCYSKPKAKITNIEDKQEESSSSSYERVEFTHLEDNRERLLKFNGQVNGKPAWVLLDSSISRNFVDEKFVQRTKLSYRR